jgi:hypothetical protein
MTDRRGSTGPQARTSIRGWLLVALLVLPLGSTVGCGAKAYQREFLAEPIMSFDELADEDAREAKWLEAREASSGGVGGAGGGCACN